MGRVFDTEIISSVVKILTDDNTNPSTGYCIEHYVGNRVFQASIPVENAYPQITLGFDTYNTDSDLPIQEGVLKIGVWYKATEEKARRKARACGARILELLDRGEASINNQGFTSQIRQVRKDSAFLLDPDEEGILHYSISLAILYGDNWSG